MVGCVSALWLTAPFGRGAVVLASDEHPDARLILNRHERDGQVAGERMTAADWRELVACEDVIELAQPLVLDSATCMPRGWLLRGNFPEREGAAEQLLDHGAHGGAVLYEEERDGVLLFIVDEARARDLLELWSRAAFDQAWMLGHQGEWAQAQTHADVAWLTDVSLELDRVALLALTIEFTEGPSAAEDFIAFELNSRKSRPEQELRQRIAVYRGQFVAPRPASPLTKRMLELEHSDRIGNVETWKAKRAATDQVFPGARRAS